MQPTTIDPSRDDYDHNDIKFSSNFQSIALQTKTKGKLPKKKWQKEKKNHLESYRYPYFSNSTRSSARYFYQTRRISFLDIRKVVIYNLNIIQSSIYCFKLYAPRWRKKNIKMGNSNVRNPILASFAPKVLPYRGLGSGIKRAIKVYPDIELIDDKAGSTFKAIIKRK